MKARKGSVKIEDDKGWLRLRFSYAGKRYAFALGLPDSINNRRQAQTKATQIELDILSGNFDPTLTKYKPQNLTEGHKQGRVTVTALYKQWMEHKATEVAPKTMEKFRATYLYLCRFFEGKPVEFLGDKDADAFLNWQLMDVHTPKGKGLSMVQVKRRIEELEAAWRFAKVDYNPWEVLASRIKVPPKQPPKPFTVDEMAAIMEGFRGDRYYYPYAAYVQFLFSTGCRTGEVIGLKWKHVKDDCTTAWIGESLSRGVRKATKTNRSRTIELPSSVVALLKDLRPISFDPEALVFTSPTGKAIDDHNFRNRAWKTVLTQVGVPYRKPYTTRSTLISHALDKGMNPVTVAQLTGHDVETLYANYSGNVSSRPRLPEIM
jgi:integrase